jgi:hypothetical protein
MGDRTKDHGAGGESGGAKPTKQPMPRKKDDPIRERRLPPLPEEDRLIEQQVEEDDSPLRKKRPRGTS